MSERIFTEELLSRATEDELTVIEDTERLLKALESPLELGIYLGILRPFPHVKKLDEFYVAMVQWRLYKDGIGPTAIIGKDGFRYNPITGERAIRRMMVSEPVRSGKSLYGSTLAPAWHKLRWAHRPLLSISSGDEFAGKWSKSVRDIIAEHPEFGQAIDSDNRSALSWRTKGSTAEYNAAGVGGLISGKNAFAIHIDDVVKSMAVAQSDAEMQTIMNIYDSAIVKRLTKDFSAEYEPGYILYIGTPYSKTDLRSQILRREGELWFNFNLAAISGSEVNEDGVWIDPATGRPDLAGRGPHQALCPEIRSYEEHLEDRRLDPRTFAAMSQGTPKVEGGNIIENIPEYSKIYTNSGAVYQLKLRDGTLKEVPEEALVQFAMIDLAISKKTYADFTVYTQFGVTPDRELLVLDVIRTRIAAPEHRDWVAARYAEKGGLTVGTENKGHDAVALAQAFYMDTNVPFALLRTKGDKVNRFITHAAPLFSTYRIFFDADAEYRASLDEELTDFPDTSHDDQVDTISLGAQKLKEIPLRVFQDREQESEITSFWKRVQQGRKAGSTASGGFSLGANVIKSLN